MKKTKEELIKERMGNLKISRKKVTKDNRSDKPTILENLDNSEFLEIEYRDIYELKKSPVDWNFYRPLGEERMMDLIGSIIDVGLQHPLILRSTESDEYILAGNNRHEAYTIIYEATKIEEYRKIPTIIKRNITDLVAEEIVVDTNFIQREMTPIEKAMSIRAKYRLMGRKGYRSEGSETRNVIAKQYGVSGRMITNYNLLNKLCEEFTTKLDNKEVSLKACLKVALLPNNLQLYIINNYNNQLDNKLLASIKENFTREHIDKLFNDVSKNETFKYVVPIHLSKEFHEMALAWLKENK